MIEVLVGDKGGKLVGLGFAVIVVLMSYSLFCSEFCTPRCCDVQLACILKLPIEGHERQLKVLEGILHTSEVRV